MDRISDKLDKHENSLTRLLRKLLKQKDDHINKQSIENAELKQLLLKQQELLNKLNDENMRLTTKLQSKNPQSHDIELYEQNKSLKQQLLVSQQHNSIMSNELCEARLQIKVLTKQLTKYEMSIIN